MGEADIVARRGHATVVHQRRVALGEFVSRVGGHIAERRRLADAAMLLQRAARAHTAFFSPSAKSAKLSPPSTTRACSEPKTASRE